MAINPIDTEVFVQNLKQAYTILRQNILICNTMVEMINNFNSLNTTGEQNTSDISELQSQVASMDAELTQLNTDLDKLETKVNANISKTETAIQNITKDLTKKVTVSSTPKIIYGTNLSAPFLYQVKFSDEPMEAGTDTSVPTTSYVWRAITESEIIPNKTEFVTQEDGTCALQLKHDNQVLYTDISINNVDIKTAYFEWSSSDTINKVLINKSQLKGYNNFNFNDITECPSKIICKNVGSSKFTYVYIPRTITTIGNTSIVNYYCIIDNGLSGMTISFMSIWSNNSINFSTITYNNT